MRIKVVTCWFPSELNPGAGSFVARDVEALGSRHEVQVVHLIEPSLDDGVREFQIGDVPVVRVPMRGRNRGDMFRAAWKLQKLIRGADLVHTMAMPALTPFRLMGPLSMPLVHTEHWSGIVRMRRRHVSWREILVLRAIFRRPKLIAAVSSFLGDALGSLTQRQVQVIPNIVDALGPFSPREPDGRINMLAVGSLNALKDPELAVQTLVELRSRGHDASLTWAGDGPLLAQTQATAERVGVAEHVSLPGFQDRSGVEVLMENSDVLLHTSQIETFSLVTAEALTAGRPVVIGREGGHRDFAQEPWAQFPRDRTPVAYADAVERAIEAGRAPELRGFGSDLASAYSEDAFLDRWEAIYGRALGR